ncbi:MAG: type II toxin-antitoxin system prevent-host-death family antitoxin [Verrucomicrobiae bacterium]|nr:type II toxin-antitoxin system prevent-host-death family antitoxin [Verrucomicrobiae bacterium]
MKKRSIKYKAVKKAPMLLRETAVEKEMQVPTITMLDLRHNAETIVKKVENGQSMILTYRGRPAVRLEPALPHVKKSAEKSVDFVKSLFAMSVSMGPMTNEEMDRLIYEY